MSQKTIALQLRTLAADTDSQALLLKEASCLSGLVALLHADNEEEVLILSLQALQFLAVPTAHHSTLVNQPGLILALTLLTDKPSIANKTLAQNVLGSLESYINATPSSATASASATAPASSSSSAAVSRRTTPGHSRAGSRGNTRPTTPREGASTGTSAFAPRYLNHVLFHISTANNTSLDKSSQSEVEKVLVGIKGVISVAVTNARDKTASAFTLYTSLRPQMLQPLVNKALEGVRGGSFTAVFVDKNGNKSAATSQQKDDTDKENQENNAPAQPQAKKPGYLSKSVLGKSAASTTSATSSSSSASTPGYLNASALNSTHSRAMQTHQTATSASDSAQGLAARYMGAKKKAAAAEPAPAPARKGILSSVTSYFW